MKKIIYLAIIALGITSCKKQNDFVTLSGKITNKNSDSIVISNPQLQFKRVLKVDENGVFKDTMKVKDGFYNLFDGKEYAAIYLQNGDDIAITLDTKEFDETLTFSGNGADESNFLAKSSIDQEAFFADEEMFSLTEDKFNEKVKSYVDGFKERLSKNSNFDSTFVNTQKQSIEGLQGYLVKMYADKKYTNEVLAKGKPSPKFTDYENYKGGTTSLDDLKGKYVYIDLWATWCQPCKAEIPFLQKVEKQFHGKKIEFVSISVDDQRDYETWKKMVADKEMGGVQLYAKGDRKFMDDYRVSGIPRFILLDPNGNIVDSNALRPSNPKLIELLKSLDL